MDRSCPTNVSIASVLVLLGGSFLGGCDQNHLGDGLPESIDCISCHGNPANPAPPLSLDGGSGTTLTGVGAHQAHLFAGRIRSAVACGECHQVPQAVDDPEHVDPLPAEVHFTEFASKQGELSPDWNRDSGRCLSTYCHGATLGGGEHQDPLWTLVDGSQIACDGCHGFPPPAPHSGSTNCRACHSGTVAGDGGIDVVGGLHINGTVESTGGHPPGYAAGDVHGPDFEDNPASCRTCHGDDLQGGTSGVSCESCHGGFATSCTFCHGGIDNATGAPPEDVAGQTATAVRGIGAHSQHLTVGSGWHKDVVCADCHSSYASALDPGHIDPRPAELAWSALSTGNGATSPEFIQGNTTCSGVYCHGEGLKAPGSLTQPDWTVVDGTQAACGTCHGFPPGGGHPPETNCDACHGEVKGPGATWVDPTRHINGTVDRTGSCGACHAVPPDPNTEDYLGGGGAHAAHVALGYACFTCHGNGGTGPTHAQGGALVSRVNLDMVFDPTVSFPGGTTMQNGATPMEAYNGGNPTCFVGCHNPVPGDTVDLANPAVWTDTTISCAECHEKAGTEPPISHDLDPDVEDDATIRAGCAECHELISHTQGAISVRDPDPSDTDSFGNSGLSGLCRTCHDGGGGPFFAGQAAADESAFWSIPCSHAAAGHDCADCHERHGSAAGTVLVDREEDLCYRCHDGSVAITNLRSPFTLPSHHPIDDAEQTGWEVECISCHNVHVAVAGNHLAGSRVGGPVLHGITGVYPADGPGGPLTWNPGGVGGSLPAPQTGWSPVTLLGRAAGQNWSGDYEAYLCFKCHTYYRVGNPGRDVSREFNPNNAHYHAVVGPSRATGWGGYLNGWSSSSGMTCSDCHRSGRVADPAGPHGSGAAPILRGLWAINTGKTGQITGHLCFNCHDPVVYAQGGNQADPTRTGFSRAGDDNYHVLHMRRGNVRGCVTCHGPVPHGWTRGYPIWVRTDPAPYSGNVLNEAADIPNWGPTGNWQEDDCRAAHQNCG